MFRRARSLRAIRRDRSQARNHNRTEGSEMKASEPIPFLDLVKPHQDLKEEFCAVFSRALDRGAFIGGEMVEQFERDFALFSDTRHCVGVGSGTDALRFALTAAGIEKDRLVVTVPNTFIATT